MAVSVRRLAVIGSSSPISRLISNKAYIQDSRAPSLSRGVNRRHFSVCSTDPSGSTLVSEKSEDDPGIYNQDFQKWPDGGGSFHESAYIDPRARIEIGAIVPSNAVLGANVCVGSGAVIGPAVTIG